jgi:hypothetical protein
VVVFDIAVSYRKAVCHFERSFKIELKQKSHWYVRQDTSLSRNSQMEFKWNVYYFWMLKQIQMLGIEALEIYDFCEMILNDIQSWVSSQYRICFVVWETVQSDSCRCGGESRIEEEFPSTVTGNVSLLLKFLSHRLTTVYVWLTVMFSLYYFIEAAIFGFQEWALSSLVRTTIVSQ